MFMIVTSRTTISWARAITPRVSQRRVSQGWLTEAATTREIRHLFPPLSCLAGHTVGDNAACPVVQSAGEKN